MTRPGTTLSLLAALLLSSVVSAGGCADAKGGRALTSDRLAAGVWGGEHARMEVGEGAVNFEFDCAAGSIDRAVVLDKEGRFDAKGTFTMQHAGPVLRDEAANSRRARYAGRVRGDTLTLTVTLAEPEEDAGTFTLRRGSEGRLTKCR